MRGLAASGFDSSATARTMVQLSSYIVCRLYVLFTLCVHSLCSLCVFHVLFSPCIALSANPPSPPTCPSSPHVHPPSSLACNSVSIPIPTRPITTTRRLPPPRWCETMERSPGLTTPNTAAALRSRANGSRVSVADPSPFGEEADAPAAAHVNKPSSASKSASSPKVQGRQPNAKEQGRTGRRR